jgi:hypothetical protein
MSIISPITNRFLTQKRLLLFFFLLFLLSSIGMFGQNKSEVNENCVCKKNATAVTNAPTFAIASIDSQIDFVGWFMGSKQSQFIQPSPIGNGTLRNITKKQILSSGIAPNKVLYRTFITKVSSQDNAIV